ncbi:MAG: ABC transporter permease [Candidatus Micrarchaeota archaeon]|nr:ABC transporter permease [Candidatus Micrarchaeota archaeon]
MRLADIIKYSFSSLKHRKIRSWLTILGIVIGIAAVVSLLTIGRGFNEEINRQLSVLGSNTIFISPISPSSAGSAAFSGNVPPSTGKLYDKDVDRLRKIPEITDIARLTMARASVAFKDKEISTMVSGIEPGVFEKTIAIEMDAGRFLQAEDRGVVIIGPKIADGAFGSDKKVGVGSYLTINGKRYRVIGVMKESTNVFGRARTQNGIFLHFEDARQLFKSVLREDEVSAIVLKTKEEADTSEVVAQIKEELDASHKVRSDNRDYSVIDPKTIQERIGNVLSLVTVFLGAIAAISLVVGGLSIASSMFTSVLERTKEIGIMKSVGADRNTILSIFLFEAGLLGMLGGVFGSLIAAALVFVGNYFGLPAFPDIWIGLGGVAFAFLIGMIFGYLPAKRAADLPPVEALRYE